MASISIPAALAIAGTAASVGSSVVGASAAGDAAKKQQQSAGAAIAREQENLTQTRADLAPYMGAGTNALTQIQKMLGIGGTGTPDYSAFTSSPGYQFMLNQGRDAIQNRASAAGGVGGGNAMKALTQYGQGLAGGSFQQFLSNLSSLAGSGQNAATTLGGIGTGVAGTQGAQIIGAGNAGAAGIMGQGNAIAGGIQGASQNALLYELLSSQQQPPTQQINFTTPSWFSGFAGASPNAGVPGAGAATTGWGQ